MKEEAAIQGASQEKKLKETGEDLVHYFGEDSSAAAEISKQMEEVVSVRQAFINDVRDRIKKVKV